MKYFKQKLNKVLDKKDVKIPEKEFVKEHKRLIDVLESPSHKDDLSEAKEQRKELQSHLNKTEISFSAFNDGTVDLEAGPSVPEEIFNQVCLELSKSLDLIDIEILEKKKKAFQFKSKHKSKKGGLTEAGRKAYNRATGSKLKRPQPGGGKRKKSFCARSKGQMKMHGISCKKDPKKRVCLARKRWACKSESESYFESLKKAKIIDFKTKKLLADFPTEQPKQLQQPSSMGMREANHLDSLRSSLPEQKMTDPEHFNSVLPHKDEKSQLDFLNTVHGDVVDYGGDIGSRVRSGYLHVKAKNHLRLADHYLRNAAKRPANQQETADRDLADAYEHLFLAKEKLKTKKPKVKKSETHYFQELKKAVIKGPSNWWKENQSFTPEQKLISKLKSGIRGTGQKPERTDYPRTGYKRQTRTFFVPEQKKENIFTSLVKDPKTSSKTLSVLYKIYNKFPHNTEMSFDRYSAHPYKWVSESGIDYSNFKSHPNFQSKTTLTPMYDLDEESVIEKPKKPSHQELQPLYDENTKTSVLKTPKKIK